MILPSFGVISEVIAAFSRKRIFGYSFVAFSSIAIAAFGFFVWGHHMFTTGQSMYSGMVFSVISFLVAIPSAIKVFNWSTTLYKGQVSLTAPMLYAIAFIGLFTVGGLTGLFLSTMAMDIHLQATYFVVAHFHYVMVGGATLGYLAGLHFWWPKMTGRMYPEWAAKVSAALVFIGFNLTFFPQFIVGYLGMPRRYAYYPEEFQFYHVMSTAGASVLAIGYGMPLVYFIWSLRYGALSPETIPGTLSALSGQRHRRRRPITSTRVPMVTWEAYEYDAETESEAQRDRELMPGAETSQRRRRGRQRRRRRASADIEGRIVWKSRRRLVHERFHANDA